MALPRRTQTGRRPRPRHSHRPRHGRPRREADRIQGNASGPALWLAYATLGFESNMKCTKRLSSESVADPLQQRNLVVGLCRAFPPLLHRGRTTARAVPPRRRVSQCDPIRTSPLRASASSWASNTVRRWSFRQNGSGNLQRSYCNFLSKQYVACYCIRRMAILH